MCASKMLSSLACPSMLLLMIIVATKNKKSWLVIALLENSSLFSAVV